jgi:hypothetical protein
MSSRHVTDLLPLWIGGDLEARESLLVEAHLLICEACRAEADALRESQAWMRSATPPFSVADRDQVRQEVLAHIASGPLKARSRRVWKGVAALAAAASLLLVLLRHGHPENTGMPAPPPPPRTPPQTLPMPPAPVGVGVARHQPAPPRPDPHEAAGPGASRIEIQTDNPQIRIIWLARATALPEGSLHSIQEDL